MACGTIHGLAGLEFGVASDELGLATTSISLTHKADKKEVRNNCGDIVGIVYYNKMTDISIDGYGTASFGTSNSSTAVGTALSLTGSYDVAGAIFVDEVTEDQSNEDFVKTSVKAVSYEGIPSV